MTANNKYINAVFNFDVETFKNLLNSEPFETSLLHDIKVSTGVPCPIYWLTQCWEIVFEHPEEWSEDCRETIVENKRRNLEIKQLFEERFNVAFKPINFYNTDFDFFRNEPDDTFEDIFGYDTSKDKMIAKGCRAIDLDLYMAVNKFDFKETERLLALGADPAFDFHFPYGNDSCLDRIVMECSFLEVELQGAIVHGHQINLAAGDAHDLDSLVGLAAHEKMYSLLSQYIPEENA